MAPHTFINTQDVLAKWEPLAAGVEETSSSLPITVLSGESLDLSFLIDENWEPITGSTRRPGLKEALVSNLIDATIANDIRELNVAMTNTHAQFRSVTGAALEAPVDRAEFLLSEIRQCLEFLFDDGMDDERDAELARLSESHSNTSSHDALALSLEGFAYFGNRFREELGKLPEFDVAMLDEALEVANRLREQSAIELSSTAQDRQKQLLSLRNRYITLLTEKMNTARRAARFVFRNHPEVARLFSSSYERKRRARSRARQTEEATAAMQANAQPTQPQPAAPEPVIEPQAPATEAASASS